MAPPLAVRKAPLSWVWEARDKPSLLKADKMDRVFLDASVLLTAVADPKSESAQLLRLCAEGKSVCSTSSSVIEECKHKLRNHAHLRPAFAEAVKVLKIVDVPTETLMHYSGMIKDKHDRHVLAGAVLAEAEYLVTLDWHHFLSPTAKRMLGNYPVNCTFPGVLLSSFRYQRLPELALTTLSGAFAIAVEPSWTCRELRRSNRPFYVLDLERVFGMWYDPRECAVKVQFETYHNKAGLMFRRRVRANDAFVCVISWDVNEGFHCLIDKSTQSLKKRWDLVPLQGSTMWIGSDRQGSNQINGKLVFHGWSKMLSPKEMQRVLDGGYVRLPERPASL